MTDAKKLRVAIAGASGFVGRALTSALTGQHDIIALARQAPAESAAGVEWRASDLFNLRDAERALAGADVAVYLVHSMMPSARLTQGTFDDLDLICADNFARAAATCGVKHIVYLGGLLPPADAPLSRHLQSRFEVEQTLGAHGVPVTTLRAGLVIGAGGSSFDMMARLVGRLPFMLGPQWTRTRSQPIALEDAVRLLAFAIERPDLAGRAYDIAGPDVVSYADMLRMVGAAQGKNTRVITLPIRTVKLSLLWVSAITGASQELVRPLVESLEHDMVAVDGLTFQKEAGLSPMPLKKSLEEAVATQRSKDRARMARKIAKAPDRRVCSVQRLQVSQKQNATAVAEEYLLWLPRALRPFLTVQVENEATCSFFLAPLRKPLLVLVMSHERSTSTRRLFYVTGGLLAGESEGARPRLEFRSVLQGRFVLAAIHDFVPRLPWLLYKITQAIVHLFVMKAFARHLTRQAV